jgi:hypothetical protein
VSDKEGLMDVVSRTVWRAFALGASLAMTTLLSTPSAGAAEPPGLCDKQITRPSSGSVGYRLRGDRCEGTYEQPTSSPGERQVALISLTCGAPPTAFVANAPAVVAWSAVGSEAVALRIETLPEVSLRYRMDARPAAAAFTWPSALLAELSITPQELSVLVLSAPKIGDIAIPGTAVLASFSDKPNVPCAAEPEARFYTRYALAELSVCAKDLTASAPADSTMCKKYPGPFSPSASIVVPLGMLKGKSGLYELAVEVRRAVGATQTPERFKIAVR